MTQRYFTYIFLVAIIFTMSCSNNKKNAADSMNDSIIDASSLIVGDSMIYGLACDGTNDSAILVYPFDGGDPITYYTLDAAKQKRIIGKPQIGDWVGLVLDKEDSTTATMVINLDLIKGTWTYPVMPTFKDFAHLSKRMQKRMERQLLENMPDSVKETYMIPREYGFTLKRGHAAQSVGKIMKGNTLEDDSPVEYPPVKNYIQWFTWNGKLILVSTDKSILARHEKKDVKFMFDTLDIISLDYDTLTLEMKNIRYGFHRKSSTTGANAEAAKKALEADKKAAEKLK